MADEYIKREAVLQAVLELPPKMDEQGYGWLGRRGVWQVLFDFPSADVQPVRHGRWELDVLDGTPGYRPVCIVCSECHRVNYGSTPYCPNCGAKMDGGET